MIERDVWLVERDTDISREELVEQAERLSQMGIVGAEPIQPVAGSAPTSNRSTPSNSATSLTSSSGYASVSTSICLASKSMIRFN